MNPDISGLYPSTNGTSQLAYFVWLPKQPENAVAVVQLIHGMSEHSGRYGEFARFLTKNGYIVCQNDHLGHGKSVNSELSEVFGYMSETDGDQHLVEDVRGLQLLMREKFKHKKHYLFGHSMGSFVGRAFIAKYGDDLAGAVFSGTGGGGLLYSATLAAVKALIKLKGGKYGGGVLKKINHSLYNKKFAPAATGNEWLSRDEAVWHAFAQDELCGFTFTLGGYKDLLTLIKSVSSKKWAAKVPKNLPVLFLSGLDDPVGDYGRGVISSYSLLAELNENVFIKLYEGARHEILNEINKDEVYEDILYFIENDGFK